MWLSFLNPEQSDKAKTFISEDPTENMHHLPTLLTSTMRQGFPEFLSLQRETVYKEVTPSPVTCIQSSGVYTFLVNSRLQEAPEEVLVGAFAHTLTKLSFQQEKPKLLGYKTKFPKESEIERKVADSGFLPQYSAYCDYCLRKYSNQHP